MPTCLRRARAAIRAVIAVATCISCGAAWGDPHYWGCAQVPSGPK